MEKLPPIQKIYEAYSALADDRFDLQPESATVRSSKGHEALARLNIRVGRLRRSSKAPG